MIYRNMYDTINTKALDLMTRQQRLDMLAKLIEWADSEEGTEYRADCAVVRPDTPTTAADILACLDEGALEQVYDALPELRDQ